MEKFGLSVALLTPFRDDGAIDAAALGAHGRSVLDGGADGVTLFGTCGEGASIAASERAGGIEALLAAGCPAERITLGIAATAVGDAAAEVAEGLAHGITRFLVLPPYYFKGCADAGLFDWHTRLMQATDPKARFILYHIPQVSGVGLPVHLVNRLFTTARGRVVAIKDSSGDWDNARALLALGTVPVLVGDERLLARAMTIGAAGSICGMGNFYPERMKRIVETGREDAALNDEIARIVEVPVIPAFKAMLAERRREAAWDRIRPPLMPLSAEQRKHILTGKAA